MTPTDSEISTTPEIAVGIQFHAQYDIKSAPVFLSADGEVFWLLLPSLVSLISGGTVQPENTIHVTSGMRKPKKDKHQH